MEYGILTLIPIVVVIGMSLITKRILESLIVGTFITYIIVDGFDFRVDGCLLSGGVKQRSPVGYISVCFVWKPDCIAGRFSWDSWLFKAAWQTLPGAKIYNVCNMDYGCSNFCR